MMQLRAGGSLVPGLLVLLLWAGTAQAVSCEKNLPASNPDEVYIDHGDGTVTDTRTGLMWKKCSEGVSGTTCTSRLEAGYVLVEDFTWANALAHAEASTFADYADWRLPNLKELSSLVEDCRAGPAINTNLFRNTYNWMYWSATPSADNSYKAWFVDFGTGYHHTYGRDTDFYKVRLVRGGL